jgi:hypothetical protein
MIDCMDCEFIHKYHSISKNRWFTSQYKFLCLIKVGKRLKGHKKIPYCIGKSTRNRCMYYKPKTQMEIISQ